jgi:Tfp pilus assembly protein PilX
MRTKENCKYHKSIAGNEDGMVIVTALMVMVMLTIIGFLAIEVSNTEVQIAGQEVVYQQNFYQAEGAVIEAVGALEAVPDPVNNPPAWLETTIDTITDEQIQTNDFWESSTIVTPEASSMDHTDFIAASDGPVSGTSLDMTSSKVYGYSIYGRCAPPRKGATVVQVGYLVAY